MNRTTPPHWLERTLRLLLTARDRETVSGDLYEEFQNRKCPHLGYFSATLWYARQALSFAPRRLGRALVQRRALALLCVFTAACGSWLGGMGLYHKHPGYAGPAIAGTIVAQALLTLLVLGIRRFYFLRPAAMAGCLALFWLAGKAITATVRGAHLEGYVLLIALALIFQAVLTLSSLRSRPDPAEISG
jgi:hypothetical protein